MAKKPLLGIEALEVETRDLFHAINKEAALPCVLVSTSFLDECLRSILGRFLVKGKTSEKILDPRGGILGSFSSRTDLCYALGLISKNLFSNLKQVGTIRNRFAHSHLSLSFDDPEITKMCGSLTFPFVNKQDESGKTVKVPYLDTGEGPELRSARDMFTLSVVLMANFLMVSGLSIKCLPRANEGWC